MPIVLRRSCAWLVSVAVVVGCSGAFTAASSDAGLADAASPVDAGKDGPFPTEVSTDAQPDSTPPRVTPCSSAHLFCDDFDDAGPDLSMRWDERSANAGPLVRSTASVSQPYALGVELGTVPEDGNTSITKRVDLPEGNVRIELDLRVTPPTTFTANSSIDMLVVQTFPVAQGVKSQWLTMNLSKDGPRLTYFSDLQDGGWKLDQTDFQFPESVFRHVTLTITTASGQVTSRIGIGSDGPVSVVYAGPRPNQLKISVGARATRLVGGSVVVDNVVVDSF